MRQLVVALLLFPSAILSQSAAVPPPPGYVYPNATWEQITTPADRAWDADKLRQLRQFIVDSTNTTGMLVVHQGKVLFEYGDVAELSYLASCRKSVLSMLYGPFVDNGTINLDATIGQLGLDDVGGLLPIEKTATVRNLLTARSGVYHPASNEGDATAMAPTRGSVRPGAFWLYNNWDFNAAGYILEQRTGRSIYQLVDSLLAKPLEMEDWRNDAQHKMGDTTRSRYPAYHMWFSTRDMARLGYLMLREGRWKDKQILSPAWVKTTTQPVTTLKEAQSAKTAYFNFGYGYLWWVWDAPYNRGDFEGAYSASGAYGQFITVMPKLDLVIAHKTKYEYGRQVPTDVYLRIVNKVVAARLEAR